MKLTLFATALLALTANAKAAPTTFILDDPKGVNNVQFTSHAPIEQIVGRTGGVFGSVSVDLDDLTKPISAHIRADLASLKSGVDRRDDDMKSARFLDVAKFPFAEFTLDSVLETTFSKLAPGKTVSLKIKGKFSVHGITKDIVVEGKATYYEGDDNLAKLGFPGKILNFDGGFTIALKDYNINRPDMIIMKLSEEQQIHVYFTATTGRKPMQ